MIVKEMYVNSSYIDITMIITVKMLIHVVLTIVILMISNIW